MASTTSGSITINADAIRRFLPVSVVLVVMVVFVAYDNSASLRNTVLRQRELQNTITAADYFGSFDSSSSSSSFQEVETEAPTFNKVPQFEDARSDSTENNFGEVPMDGATPDMITPADEYMMEGSEVPSFGQQATVEPMFGNKVVSATADQVETDAPTVGLSADAQGFVVETGLETIPPTDALGFTAEEAQDNAVVVQETTENFVPDPEDVFSAALLFTDVPTTDFTSGDSSFVLETYEVNTKVVMDIDIGWQSGIIEWYDAASDNYGVLWSTTGTTQIFAAGRTFDDMVNMGRDSELFALGSSLDAAAIAKNQNKNNDESDKGTIIGLSIMGVSMIALMMVAAVVLRRRSSIKRGKSVPLRNLNNSYRDDDEGFHDEPSQPPTGLFQDNEPAGFLTVEGQIIQEGISGALGDPDLFPDNPELYRESI